MLYVHIVEPFSLYKEFTKDLADLEILVAKMLPRTWQKYSIENKTNAVHETFAYHSTHYLFLLIFAGLVRIFRRGDSTKVDDFIWSEFFYHYSIIFLLFLLFFLSMYCLSGESEDRWEALGKTINLDQPWATMEIIVRLSILGQL
jgi:hypothetical protein